MGESILREVEGILVACLEGKYTHDFSVEGKLEDATVANGKIYLGIRLVIGIPLLLSDVPKETQIECLRGKE